MTFPACYLPYKFQVFALVSNSQKRTKTRAEPMKGNYIVRTEDLTMQTCTYGHILGAEKFIHQKYDEQKSSVCLDLKRPTDVLRLNKEQYERMLQVAEELEEFSNTHPFDITKYVKE